ncbi:unnamed protein product [Bursaphelenchus okinawaensis]|uniref:NADP-dependent oxidoreductase domain-containing protein n=1 Tax=Bursaphelenchus okinawaensis TaxID=465554 RepID=A0A811KN97_9BILA|nr:unnamed protein product [Bursaphelenchus okinawaensis]CAG9106664.1 unnamed protein product [Bursaphelenchus okinawaensis]
MFCCADKNNIMSSIPYVKLSNGVKQPKVGLGTFMLTDKSVVKNAVFTALDNGYRLIDTATMYDNEEQLGEVLDDYFATKKLRRSEVFITSKLLYYHMTPEWTEKMIKESLKKLKTAYLDMYMIHLPFSFKCDKAGQPQLKNKKPIHDTTPIIDTWRVLEKYYKTGVFRAIGIANFNKSQLQYIWNEATVKPHCLQVESHIFWPNREIIDYAKCLGLTVTTYGNLGSQVQPEIKLMDVDVVRKLAEKYRKTAAQILLIHQIELGYCIIPKSQNPTRIKENINGIDFELSPGDVKKLDKIKDRIKFYRFEDGIGHPEYPWPLMQVQSNL